MSPRAVVTLLFVAAATGACGGPVPVRRSVDEATGNAAQDEPEPSPPSPAYGYHSEGWETLPIRFRFGQEIGDVQRRGIEAALAQWNEAAGLTLAVIDPTPAPIYRGLDLYSRLDNDVNELVGELDWDRTGKPMLVLATTIWDNDEEMAIVSADVVFNLETYTLTDSEADATDSETVVDAETLALHELGHALGLAHVHADADAESIMVPTMYIGSRVFRRSLSAGDVERIRRLYRAR